MAFINHLGLYLCVRVLVCVCEYLYIQTHYFLEVSTSKSMAILFDCVSMDVCMCLSYFIISTFVYHHLDFPILLF